MTNYQYKQNSIAEISNVSATATGPGEGFRGMKGILAIQVLNDFRATTKLKNPFKEFPVNHVALAT